MPKIGWINWNGTRSDSLGIVVSGSGTFNAAEMDVTVYEIPGRSGDLIVSNNRFRNVQVIYPAFVPNAFETRAQPIRNWLRSTDGYARLEDNYDTDHYRLGRPVGMLEFSPVGHNDAANFQIAFDCKPQRFLKNATYRLERNHIITNPTPFPAYPLFGVYTPHEGDYIEMNLRKGTGPSAERSLYRWTFLATMQDKHVAIDCETMNVYEENGTENYNNAIEVTQYVDGAFVPSDWPAIPPGTDAFFNWVLDEFPEFNQLVVNARWWEL